MGTDNVRVSDQFELLVQHLSMSGDRLSFARHGLFRLDTPETVSGVPRRQSKSVVSRFIFRERQL